MSGSSRSRFITVHELCEMLGISRSRFTTLQKRGVFPSSLRTSSNRPVFDHNLTQQCLDVVRSRVGINGEPILFNAKKKAEPSKKRPFFAKDKHEDLIAALASLGLSASSEQVGMAIAALPTQGADLDHPALIKAVFLHLKKQG